MAPPKKSSRLPVPRQWLTRVITEEQTSLRPDREHLLGEKSATTGTKAHFRQVLLSAGWNSDYVDQVVSDKFVARLGLLEMARADKPPDFNKITQQMKKLGVVVEVEEQATTATAEVWDSVTRHPWWTSTLRGNRQVMLVAKTDALAQRASASFFRDIWANLGAAPEFRLPRARRLNLLSYMSPEGLLRFEQHVGPYTDLVVFHGMDSKDEFYRNTGYLEAISGVAPHAMIVYECVPAPDLDTATLVTAATRGGFQLIWGVTRG